MGIDPDVQAIFDQLIPRVEALEAASDAAVDQAEMQAYHDFMEGLGRALGDQASSAERAELLNGLTASLNV